MTFLAGFTKMSADYFPKRSFDILNASKASTETVELSEDH